MTWPLNRVWPHNAGPTRVTSTTLTTGVNYYAVPASPTLGGTFVKEPYRG